MIVYHGSSHNFKTLRIIKKNARQSSQQNEGYGIYFSSDIDVARSYGKYLYILSVNDSCLADLRIKRNCDVLVAQLERDVYKRFKFYLREFINLNQVSGYIHSGNVAIVGLSREVKLLLDSSEFWYMRYGKWSQAVFDFLDRWKGYPKAYFFTYNIKDCGVLKDVSPSVVQVVKKEFSHGVK